MLVYISHLSLAFNKFRENPKPLIKRLLLRTLRGLEAGTSAAVKFLKLCYVDGTKALLEGRYTRDQAAVIIAGSLPAILGALLITCPGVLFPTPSHHAFYHFGDILRTDPTSLIPMALGAVTSTLGLRIPLG